MQFSSLSSLEAQPLLVISVSQPVTADSRFQSGEEKSLFAASHWSEFSNLIFTDFIAFLLYVIKFICARGDFNL